MNTSIHGIHIPYLIHETTMGNNDRQAIFQDLTKIIGYVKLTRPYTAISIDNTISITSSIKSHAIQLLYMALEVQQVQQENQHLKEKYRSLKSSYDTIVREELRSK